MKELLDELVEAVVNLAGDVRRIADMIEEVSNQGEDDDNVH